MKEIEEYYDRQALYEWQRMDRHPTEFAVTKMAMSEFLPPPPKAVLDIGGGPGRYAIHLSKEGYSVSLADISRNSIDLAQRKAQEEGVALAAVFHGDAVDLSQMPCSAYDAVLLMGPFYHLLEPEARTRAVQEARRMLTSGGVIFATFVTRYANIRYAAAKNPALLVDDKDYFFEVLETGVHDLPGYFTKAYFVHPNEVVPLMESAGFSTLRLMGCEGVAMGHEEMLNELSGDEWETWVEFNYRLGQDPALFGASDHLLYVGQASS